MFAIELVLSMRLGPEPIEPMRPPEHLWFPAGDSVPKWAEFPAGSRRFQLLRGWLIGCGPVVVLVLVLLVSGPAQGQTPSVSSPNNPPTLPVEPTLPTEPEAVPAKPVVAESTEARLRRMEEVNNRLLRQLETLSKQYDDLSKRVGDPAVRPAEAQVPGGTSDGKDGANDAAGTGAQGTIGRGTDNTGTPGTGGAAGGTAVPASDGKNVTSNRARGAQGTVGRVREEAKPRSIKTALNNGLRFTSDDDEFQLIFHDLTQVEYRSFPGLGGHSVLKDGFFIPRQRYYFTGRVTKNVEFYTDLNRGYGSIDLLDAFLTFNFDPNIQLRVGRTKTPTSYEYYQIAEGDLIAPERSLFTGNYSGNRQEGAMLLGQLFDKRAEYAVGVFNGPRRSFQDFNADKDLFAFFNFRPFQANENLSALKYFNVGGEYDFGNELNPLQPSSLRTANDQSTAASGAVLNILSPSFLTFNNNVNENGFRDHYSAWIAWYYKSFNLLAQYDGGLQNYSTGSNSSRVAVPLNGYFVQAYYFLTGEQISRRVDIKPLKNFGFKNGKLQGLGAIEVHSRFSALNLGQNVFTGGLADPNIWSANAYTVDTGLNWYLNQYTKIYFDWQYAGFGDSVFNGTAANGQTRLTRSTNLLWLRFQLFF